MASLKQKIKEKRSANNNTSSSFIAPQVVQRKLEIGASNDSYEIEADRVADQVMNQTEPLISSGSESSVQIQRKCTDCEEDQIQKKSLASSITPLVQRTTEGQSGQTTASNSVSKAINQSRGGGRPLQSQTRSFMENRFGSDFSNVRIHNDNRAATLSRSLNAQAFTVGNDIYFNHGFYNPNSYSGRHLLAHELTHTIQQGRSNSNFGIQRNVAGNSNCPANVHNAPADPIASLTTVDAMAQSMALSASHLLFMESVTFNTPEFGRSSVFDAYSNWFGTPIQTSSGRWRSRFRSSTFATENEAIEHELTTLSNRFSRIHRWLVRDHRYICPGTRSYTIPGCSPGPCGSMAAQTCAAGSTTIGICPEFWNEPAPTDRSQAAVLIHEAIHPLFHFRHHGTANVRVRGRNPGCYQGFVLEVFNTGLTPGDCTPI